MPEIFYPSFAVNLVLRFDEQLMGLPQTPGQSAEDLANAIMSPVGQARDGAGALKAIKDKLTAVFAIVPTRASLELPGYRQAPKFSLSFLFKDFPVDPRVLRAVGVEIFIGTVPAGDFAKGMRGFDVNGRLASQVLLTPANLRSAGVVDSIVTEHDDKGSSVTMEGRGLQGIFLDGKIDPKTLSRIDPTKPIHNVVEQVLSLAPIGAKIPVAVDPTEWPFGVIPAPMDEGIFTRANLGSDGASPSASMTGDANKLNFWDVITRVCFLVGAVPYFDGHTLRVRPARSLYRQVTGGTTPFAGGVPRRIPTRDNRSSMTVNHRLMIFGRNIERLKFERKMAGAALRPTVVCVSVDTSSTARGKDRLIQAQWPPANETDATTTRVAPSGDSAAKDVLRIPIPGVRSKERLLQVAQDVYEEIGRGELSGSCESKDLSSFGGSNSDTDMLRLTPGDAVEFLTDASGISTIPPVVSELNALAAQSVQEAEDAVARRLGGRKDLARALVGAARGTFKNLQNVFRVNTVRYSWGIQEGIGVDFDFQNYIESRNDKLGFTPYTQDELDAFSDRVGNAVQGIVDRAAAAGRFPPKGSSSKGGP